MSVTAAASAATTSTSTATSTSKSNMVSKDDFLKILVAQLQNQNPLDPMKPEDFLSQLSQLSQVEQLNNISSTLDSMSKSISSSQWVSAIGKRVNATSNVLSKGDQVTFLPSADYDTITLSVKDLSTGDVTTKKFYKGDDLTYTNTGDSNVQIAINAVKDNQTVDCNVLVLKVVKGITTTDTGTYLVFGNDETIDASSVKVIKE